MRTILHFAAGAAALCVSAYSLAADSTRADEPTALRRDYEEYALHRRGDVPRGKQVFEKTDGPNCAKCHSVDGHRRFAGPDLASVGDKFERAELIQSILEPSARIAIGYGNTVVQTDSGTVHAGTMQRVTSDWIELLEENSRPVRISTAEVVGTQESDVSLMPEGLEKTMTCNDFVDLLEYLQSLRQNLHATVSLSTPNEIPPCVRPVEFEPLFESAISFDHPVWIGRIPGAEESYVVLEHAGKSWIVEKHSGEDRRTQLLDLSGAVRTGGATGLLGFAFHPKFLENRRYFLKYHVVEDGRICSIVEERLFNAEFRGDSGQPPRRLLKIPAVTQDHNGGSIVFGPDGCLYVGTGDTGPQGDPRGHGQDLGTLLGKMLRIDVDRSEGDQPYAIPAGNPFVNVHGVKPEIWAYGFREPWRFSFDRQTSDLWVGDVGQDRYEEATIVRAGENHGWNVFEGATPYSDAHRREGEKYVSPVISYPRRLGISVTGGHVYRGDRAPEMEGRYVFGDFESRRLWALQEANRQTKQVVEIGRAPSRIVSLAEDVDGELLMVGYDDGVIYRLDFDDVNLTPLTTRLVAETAEQSPVLWRYSVQQPGNDWTAAEFNDAAWSLAPGGFGTPGTPGAIIRTD